MTVDYKALCDALARRLRDVPGVISVGIGKENNKFVLVVAIDPDHFEGGVPESFRGIDVITRDLGIAKLHFSGRLGHAYRHSTVEQ